MSISQLNLDIQNWANADLFAGGGGFSEAFFQATGFNPDIAINHSDNAISMHRANHPQTKHYITDIFDVDPKLALNGKPLGHLHLSPDCTHHSQAAGGQPRDGKIRSLSWVALKWLGQARPMTMTLENVPQILAWSPLIAKRDKETNRVVKLDGSVADIGEVVPRNQQFLVPDPKRKGKTWKRFISTIKSMGYEADYRTMRGSDWGGHTTRDRLFMVARRDGQPITWPKQTHYKKPARGQKKWLGAYECIDFDLPSKSIFGRKKSLANATLKRIAKGIKKYVIDSDNPFVVSIGNDIVTPINRPISTPVLIQAGHGEGKLGGIQRWGAGHKSIKDPLGTITGSGGHALATPILAKFRGNSAGCDLREPMPTVTAGGKTKRPAGNGHALGLITAHIAQMNGGFNTTPGHDLCSPLSTITNTGSQQQLVTANLITLRNNCLGISVDDPLPTVTADGQHHALVQCTLSQSNLAGALTVAEFMFEYLNEGADKSIFENMSQADKLSLVTVTINGVAYVIVDIYLRMLVPRELYRCMDFPDSYIIDRGHDGRQFTKSQMVHMCGNSISIPPVVALLKELFKNSAMRLAA
jgi:DNA (cytosine-5)-methyltransferase 1